MPEGELSIDFTGEELVVLSHALGLELPLPPPASLVGADEAVRAALVDLARRSLLVRRYLSNDGLSFHVVPAVRKMLEVIAEPGVIVRVSRTADVSGMFGPVDPLLVGDTYLVRPDVGIELRALDASSGYRLTPFAPVDLLDRIARLTYLSASAGAAPDVRAFDAPPDALAACLRLASAGRVDAAVGSLMAEKVHEPSARAFVAVFGASPVVSTVEVSHKPSSGVLAGGVVRWIDGAAAGVWVVPVADAVEELELAIAGPWSAPPSVPSLVTVTPATIDTITDELLSFLPG